MPLLNILKNEDCHYTSIMNDKRNLSQLSVGERGYVSGILTGGSMRRRFLDIGLTPGTEVVCVGESPLGDPLAFLVRGAEIAIRRSDARGIILI